MAIQITRIGKFGLYIDTPVMPAAGTFGFGDAYRNLIDIEKIGALVTNPVTYEPYSPASGTRVVPLDAGVLLHTGIPNPGIRQVVMQYRQMWAALPVPVIVHVVENKPERLRTCCEILDREESVDAIEVGLYDDITYKEAADMIAAATNGTEKPVIARLPVYDAFEIAEGVAEAGADALVVAAPPRGSARDPLTGRLVNGRVYGPLVKPMVLQLVQNLRQRVANVPIIGAGGIHSPQDARDYLDVGAVAVQVDAVTWVQPNLLERIARDLGGALKTRLSDALPDEWNPDMGDTEFKQLFDDPDKND
jgi:dihydroorotate dehydrogenase (NAD+) catalytic subunit